MIREADISWRTAHQITAVLVRQSKEDDRRVTEMRTSGVERVARAYTGEPLGLDQDTIDEVVDVERAITARAMSQGVPHRQV
jgi:argininosuccinate lyase